MTQPSVLPARFRLAGVCCFAGVAIMVLGDARAATRTEDKKLTPNPFHARLLEIARSYEPFGRVDDQSRWAPYYCRMPSPAAARFSASGDKNTHGLKLYSLFARDQRAYQALSKTGQPAGQVLVKQSWVPEPVKDAVQVLRPVVRQVRVSAGDAKRPARLVRDTFLPYARKDGRWYKAARQADLFIMYKLDPATAGTDNGWVYGTVTADGKQVTSAGKVASCMKCHQKATSDRLFGLPK